MQQHLNINKPEEKLKYCRYLMHFSANNCGKTFSLSGQNGKKYMILNYSFV